MVVSLNLLPLTHFLSNLNINENKQKLRKMDKFALKFALLSLKC